MILSLYECDALDKLTYHEYSTSVVLVLYKNILDHESDWTMKMV